MMLFISVFGFMVATLCVIILANRFRRIDYSDIEIRRAGRPLPQAGPDLRVLTWNTGYGALGKDADLFTDGGTSFRALSKQQIKRASDAIAAELSRTPFDIICIQETAKAGVLTRNVDVQSVIDKALPDRDRYFWADLKTILLPRLLGNANGMASYSAKASSQCRIVELPDATTVLVGLFKKPYVGLMNRLPILGTDKAWVIINIHLPFFRVTKAQRTAQLARLFDVAQDEYNQGNYVIIAGDWNSRLYPTSFAHTTNPKVLTWYSDLPKDGIPSGWRLMTDPKTPTVRSVDAAFRKGQTYTAVFDGFLVSPNVRVSTVKTRNLDFAYSHHQSVEATFCVGPS